MLGFAILLAFNLLGMALQTLGLPMPGPVTGLILLALCLFAGLVKLAWIEEAADVLLNHMLLFFAPVIVGVVDQYQVLQAQFLPWLLTLALSLVAVMLTTGWTATLLLKLGKGSSPHA